MSSTPSGHAPLVLDIERLRSGVNAVLDLAVAQFGTSVDLHRFPACKDYYWRLTAHDAFSMRDDIASQVVAGQTSDDLVELDEMLAEREDQVLWHSLEHLAELLRLLAVLLPAPEAPHGH